MEAVKIIKKFPGLPVEKNELVILKELWSLDPDTSNIIKWKDSFTYQDHMCMRYELLDQDLHNYIKARGEGLLIPELKSVIRQVATALQHLHSFKIVHADIRPENIMIVDRRQQPIRVRLVDFGLAFQIGYKIQSSRSAAGYPPPYTVFLFSPWITFVPARLIELSLFALPVHHQHLNTSKTKELVIDFGRDRPRPRPVQIGTEEVEGVQTYKYLGLWLDNRLDWTSNTRQLYKKTQSRMYFLRRLRSFNICRKLLWMFYQSVVASILSYAVVCWGGECDKSGPLQAGEADQAGQLGGGDEAETSGDSGREENY
ncbi:Homeodomain-interacting protein kinase 1 [Takifugu flavidus]|uniref:Homeodomain-interacting protein kinase 1 n=1 Tax=Takifugu flavidus TaxID=433684 RepID=A0A5C6MRU6_9TELE|nr:Homeodomain-interacting protein kinase 1 [Takifugu flavidus]